MNWRDKSQIIERAQNLKDILTKIFKCTVSCRWIAEKRDPIALNVTTKLRYLARVAEALVNRLQEDIHNEYWRIFMNYVKTSGTDDPHRSMAALLKDALVHIQNPSLFFDLSDELTYFQKQVSDNVMKDDSISADIKMRVRAFVDALNYVQTNIRDKSSIDILPLEAECGWIAIFFGRLANPSWLPDRSEALSHISNIERFISEYNEYKSFVTMCCDALSLMMQAYCKKTTEDLTSKLAKIGQ